MVTERIVRSKQGKDLGPFYKGFIIHSIPASKPLDVTRIIRDPNGLTLAIDAKGKIYSPGLLGARMYSEYSNISAKVVTLLAKLGVITQEQADAHTKARDEQIAREDARWRLKEFEETAEKYGLKIAKSQMDKLRKLAFQNSEDES